MIKTAVEQIMEYEDLKILLLLTDPYNPNDISHFFNYYLQSRPTDVSIQERVKFLTMVVEDTMSHAPIYKEILNKLLVLV